MDALLLGASPNSLSVARSLGRTGLRVAVAETTTDLAIKRSRFVEQFLELEDDDAAITAQLMDWPGRVTDRFYWRQVIVMHCSSPGTRKGWPKGTAL